MGKRSSKFQNLLLSLPIYVHSKNAGALLGGDPRAMEWLGSPGSTSPGRLRVDCSERCSAIRVLQPPSCSPAGGGGPLRCRKSACPCRSAASACKVHFGGTGNNRGALITSKGTKKGRLEVFHHFCVGCCKIQKYFSF